MDHLNSRRASRLARSSDTRSILLLTEVLKDGKRSVQIAAAKGLASSVIARSRGLVPKGSPDLMAPIKMAIKHKEAGVRAPILGALKQIDPAWSPSSYAEVPMGLPAILSRTERLHCYVLKSGRIASVILASAVVLSLEFAVISVINKWAYPPLFTYIAFSGWWLGLLAVCEAGLSKSRHGSVAVIDPTLAKVFRDDKHRPEPQVARVGVCLLPWWKSLSRAMKSGLLLVWIIAGVFGLWEYSRYAIISARFRDQASRYASFASLPANGELRIRGKVVTVEKGSGVVDGLMFALPREMWAVKQEEARTVVLVERGKFASGRYTDGSDAISNYIELSLVDNANPVNRGTKTFFGSDPPKTVTAPELPSFASREGTVAAEGGSADEHEVIRYLRHLASR